MQLRTLSLFVLLLVWITPAAAQQVTVMNPAEHERYVCINYRVAAQNFEAEVSRYIAQNEEHEARVGRIALFTFFLVEVGYAMPELPSADAWSAVRAAQTEASNKLRQVLEIARRRDRAEHRLQMAQMIADSGNITCDNIPPTVVYHHKQFTWDKDY